MKISQRIKNLRKSIKLTQAEFGKICGLSYQAISEIERGKSIPSKTLIAFLKLQYGENFGLEKPKSGAGAQKTDLPADLTEYKVARLFEGHEDAETLKVSPEKFPELVQALWEILGARDPAIREAILANLYAFKMTAKLSEENQRLRKEVETYRKEMEKHQPPEGREEQREYWVKLAQSKF